MLLSEAVKGIEGTMVSDGVFHCIAFATESEQAAFLTFLEKEKFLSALDNPNISCVLITRELAEKVPAHVKGVFICERPKATLFQIHNTLSGNEAYVGASFDTEFGEECHISPLVAIDSKNVRIGNRVTIEPFVVIKGRVSIGNDVVIRSGTVIGCKGFSFSKDENGSNLSVIDTASIEIQDNVELFEQVTVSTGIFPWEKTVIGSNTKVDTRVFIAHGSHVGRNCLLVSGATICGNCTIGDDVWIGACATVSNRIKVGDRARVSIGAIVTKDVPVEATVTGNFAIPHATFMSNLKKSLFDGQHTENRPRGGDGEK